MNRTGEIWNLQQKRYGFNASRYPNTYKLGSSKRESENKSFTSKSFKSHL